MRENAVCLSEHVSCALMFLVECTSNFTSHMMNHDTIHRQLLHKSATTNHPRELVRYS